VNDAQLLRYSRHILLNELGDTGQDCLLQSHALVLGAGGLGSAAALYLAASGVGRITLIDHDTVDLTNLQRQIAHTTARIGQLKVESARDAMLALNPGVDVQIISERADAALLNQLVAQADVALDCTAGAGTFAILLGIEALKRKGGTLLIQGEMTDFPNFPIAKVTLKYITIKCARGHSYKACELALQQLASKRFPLDLVTTHTFGLTEADYAIKSVGNEGAKDVIHVSLLPWK